MSFLKARYFKLTAAILAAMLFSMAIAACTKDNGGKNTAEVSGAKTTAKTTASAQKAASATGTKSANKADASGSPVSAADRTGQAASDIIASGEDSYSEKDSDMDETSESEGKIIDESKSYDLGGRNVIISVWGPSNPSRVPSQDHLQADKKQLWESARKMEEKYNCKIVWEECQVGSQYTKDITTFAMAGTEYRDVLFVFDDTIYPKLVDSGHFLRLEDYVPQDSDVWKEFIGWIPDWKGSHYAFSEMGTNVGYAYGFTYNDDIMQRNGIDIWSYVVNDNWNWETFLDVLKTCTVDFNADGIIDQWGMTASAEYLGNCLVFGNGGNIVSRYGDTYKFDMNSPQNVRALQFMSDLYNIHKVTAMGRNWKNDIVNGVCAIVPHPWGSWSSSFNPDQGKNLYLMPAPKGPDRNSYLTGIAQYLELYAFPSNIKDPEAVVAFAMDLYNDRLINLKDSNPLRLMAATNWFANGPAENVERYMWLRETQGIFNTALTRKWGTLYTNVINNIYSKIIRNEVPVTTALDSNSDAMQAIIDEIMNY